MDKTSLKRFKIEFIEPNSDLAEGYVQKAEDSAQEIKNVKKKEWKIETAYYTMYQSLYALLTRAGIKCEVHAGTFLIIERFFTDYFSSEDMILLRTAFEARKDATYYVNRDISDETLKRITEKAPSFLVKCKGILSRLDEKSIVAIREKLRKAYR